MYLLSFKIAFFQKLNETYTITSRSPGAVLLINNKLFPHHLEEEHRDRKGSDKDVYRVQALVKTMGYLLFEDTCFENIVDREVHITKLLIN